MSAVRVVHGTATVAIDALQDIETASAASARPVYFPDDLVEATVRALLALDSPRSKELASGIIGATT